MKGNVHGEYTDDANLYQDLMKYCIFLLKNNNNGSFDYWSGLGYWLLDNNKEFLNRYKTSKNKEQPIENIQKRVKRKLNNLEELGLIQNIGTRKQRKGSGSVPVYKYTDFGYLLAWIIQSFDSSMSEEANAQIYRIIETILKIDKDAPSLDIFILSFLRKCKDNRVFGEIVGLFKEILRSDMPVKTITDLLTYAMNLNFPTLGKREYFNKIWDMTMEELDPAVKQLVLYHLKLDIEEKMEMQSRFLKEFEKMRYRIRESPHMIALEGRCFSCGLYIAIGMPILKYRDKILHAYGISLNIISL